MEPAKAPDSSRAFQPQTNILNKYIKIPFYIANQLHYLDPEIKFTDGKAIPARELEQGFTYVNLTELFNKKMFQISQECLTDATPFGEVDEVEGIINRLYTYETSRLSNWVGLAQIDENKLKDTCDLITQDNREALAIAAYIKAQLKFCSNSNKTFLCCLFIAERFLARNNLVQLKSVLTNYEHILGKDVIESSNHLNLAFVENYTKDESYLHLILEILRSQKYTRTELFDILDKFKLLDQLTDEGMSRLITNFRGKIEEIRELIKLLSKEKPRHLTVAVDDWSGSLGLAKLDGFIGSLRDVAYVNGQSWSSDPEEKFRNHLTLRAFALFAGDSFIDEMEEEGVKYEGAAPSVPMDFVIPSLDYFAETKKRKLSDETKAKVKEASAELNAARTFAERFEDIRFSHNATAAMDELSQRLHDHLEQQKSMLLPLGWGGNVGAHAILFDFKLSSDGNHYECFVYNAGEGSEYQGMTNEPRATGATVKSYKIPKEEVSPKFLRLLLEPLIEGGSKRDGVTQDYGPLDFYAYLEKYQVTLDPSLENWMKLQFSGTCSMRCLLAYLHYKLGSEDYDVFKRFIKHEGVIGLIDKQGESLVDRVPGLRTLGFTFQDLHRHFLKEIMAGVVTDEKILRWTERLNELELSRRNLDVNIAKAKRPFPATSDDLSKVPKNSSVIEKILGSLMWKIEFPYENSTLNLPRMINFLDRAQDISGLLRSIQSLSYMSDHREAFESTISQLFTLINSPRFTEMCNNKETPVPIPQSLKLLVSSIKKETDRYFGSARMDNMVNPVTIKNINKAYFICYKLAIECEQLENVPPEMRIASLGIRIEPPTKYEALYLDSQSIKELEQITCSGRLFHLFMYNNYQGDPLNLPPTEESFYNKWMNYDAQTKLQVEQAYELMKRSNQETYDASAWMATYMLTNQLLPTYIRDLFEMAIFSRLAIPGKIPFDKELVFQEQKKEPSLVKPTANNGYKTGVGFYANPLEKYNWLEALIVNPERYHRENKPNYKPPIPPKANGKLVELENQFSEESQEVLSTPIRCELDMDSKYYIHFDKDIANFLIHLKNCSTDHLIFFLEEVEQLSDKLLEPEFQVVLNDYFTRNSLNLIESIRKDPNQLFTFYQEFFKRIFLKMVAFLAINPYNSGCLRAVCFLLEWQTRVGNLFTSVDPSYSFANDVQKRLYHLSKNPLAKSNDQFKGYLAQIKVISHEYTKDDPAKIKELILGFIVANEIKKRKGDLDIASTYLYLMTRSVYRNKVLEIDQFFAKGGPLVEDVLKEILNNIGVKASDPLQWAKANSIIDIRVGQTVYYYNIQEDRLTINGSNTQREFPKIFSAVFDDRQLTNIRFQNTANGQEFYAQDGNDIVYLNTSRSLLMKKLDASALGYRKNLEVELMNEAPKPGDVVFHNTIRWKFNNGMESRMYFVDQKTNQLIAEMRNDGIRLTEYPDKSFKPCHSFLKSFNQNSLLLIEDTKDPYPTTLLMLPGFMTADGSLSFEFKVDDKGIGKWVNRRNPNQWISQDQMTNINSKEILVLENSNGTRTALVPFKPFAEVKLSDRGPYEPVRPVQMVEVPMIGLNLEPKNVDETLLFAYNTLQHAKLPEDYQKALNYLQGIVHFAQFTPDQYKMLAWIILSVEESKDHSVFATSVRLYAFWLIKNNQLKWGRINPEHTFQPKEIPLLTASGEVFRSYLNTNLITTPLEEKLLKEYNKKKANLPRTMRIEHVLSQAELRDWVTNLQEQAYSQATLLQVPRLLDPSDVINGPEPDLVELRKKILQPVSTFTEVKMHPTTEQFCAQFPVLYKKAASGNPIDKKKVEEVLQLMINDKNKENLFLRRVLFQCLMTGSSAFERFLLDPTVTDFTGFQLKYDLLMNFISKNAQAVMVPKTRPTKEKTTSTTPTISSQPLSFMDYRQDEKGSLNRLQGFYHEHYQIVRPKIVKDMNRFVVNDNRNFVQKGVDEINEDLIIGAQRNGNRQRHQFNGNLRELQNDIIIEKGLLEGNLDTLKNVILNLANSVPMTREEKIQREVRERLGEKQPVSIEDLKILFLRGDAKDYKQALGTLDDETIKRLDRFMGQYLIMARRVNHMEQILQDIDSGAIEKAGEKLSMGQNYTPDEKTRSYIVFEEILGLYLRKDQVEALEQLIPKGAKVDNVMLQRIQGAGKSLVFGHLLALLKADGEHLSVHVVPTPQYATAIYDMERLSRRAFRQKERVLEFNDSPQHDSLGYLDFFHRTLQEAISNKEYVTLTKETLLALRDKYIKYLESVAGKRSYMQEMQIGKLKQILLLLRSKAIFTFDEAHLAFDPYKELNMPVGAISKINKENLTLVREVIFLSKENTKEEIVRKLLANVEVRQSFKIVDKSQADDVAKYIKGEIEELPSFLRDWHAKGSQAGNLVEITRQMLSKNLLKDLQSKSIQEEHGFPLIPQQKQISVPYIANMKPAANSEFSDSLVMMINTFILYENLGIKEEQTKSFVEYMRELVGTQLIEMGKTNIDAKLEDTELAKLWMEKFGEDIRAADLDDKIKIKAIHAIIQKDPIFKPMIMRFAQDKILGEIDLYEKQVTANGQNAASMAKSFISYTASLQNKNMAPHGTRIVADVGTNGQTIDLFLKKKMVCLEMPKDPKALVKSIKNNPKLAAFIDSGCFFRGFTNLEVARMIVAELEPPRKGVLFFDTDGNLNFLGVNKTDPVKLSGTTPAIIAQETSLTLNELFTYYDQDHITGIDILQHAEAQAIVTCGEKTELHQLLQGGRRFRDLENQQTLTFVIDTDAAAQARTKLTLDKAKPLDLQNMLTFVAINEIESGRKQNLLFCMQKLENSLQQKALDLLYKIDEVDDEDKIYRQLRSLFIKTTTVDYIKTYATKIETISIENFMQGYIQHLLSSTRWVFSKEEQKEWLSVAQQIVREALPSLEPTIAVTQEQKGNPEKFTEHLSSRTQIRHQEVQAVQKNVVVEQRSVVSKQAASKGIRDFQKFKQVIIIANRMEESYLPNNSISSLLEYEKKEEYRHLFDDTVGMVESIIKVFEGEDSFLNSPRQCAFYAVSQIKGKWQLVGYSASEIPDVMKVYQQYNQDEGPAFVITAKGKLVPHSNLSAKQIELFNESKEIKALLVQAMFSRGDLQYLERPDLFAVFCEWALDSTRKDKVIKYFKNEIDGKHPGINNTPAYQFLASLV